MPRYSRLLIASLIILTTFAVNFYVWRNYRTDIVATTRIEHAHRIRVSHDGNRVAVAGLGGVEVFRTSDWKSELFVQTKQVSSVAWSEHDEVLLLCTDGSPELLLIDSNSGDRLATGDVPAFAIDVCTTPLPGTFLVTAYDYSHFVEPPLGGVFEVQYISEDEQLPNSLVAPLPAVHVLQVGESVIWSDEFGQAKFLSSNLAASSVKVITTNVSAMAHHLSSETFALLTDKQIILYDKSATPIHSVAFQQAYLGASMVSDTMCLNTAGNRVALADDRGLYVWLTEEPRTRRISYVKTSAVGFLDDHRVVYSDGQNLRVRHVQ
ncbi:MAG: hypothetical protein KDA69_05030 [Planctomycetaceae bacterium]|nr:hypothetical protein [Planctomycetaceae bacterium]MCA9043661.1 hypothetical protein [Planctomycetaceae bacterium]MCB9949845.1 hypothetical protein [Planctomycetaceae bacterium]